MDKYKRKHTKQNTPIVNFFDKRILFSPKHKIRSIVPRRNTPNPYIKFYKTHWQSFQILPKQHILLDPSRTYEFRITPEILQSNNESINRVIRSLTIFLRNASSKNDDASNFHESCTQVNIPFHLPPRDPYFLYVDFGRRVVKTIAIRNRFIIHRFDERSRSHVRVRHGSKQQSFYCSVTPGSRFSLRRTRGASFVVRRYYFLGFP